MMETARRRAFGTGNVTLAVTTTFASKVTYARSGTWTATHCSIAPNSGPPEKLHMVLAGEREAEWFRGKNDF